MIRARISRLSIRGYRRFQAQRHFEFPGPDGRASETLVFAGPNGSGKSTIFEAILYALGREALLHRQLRQRHRQQWLAAALSSNTNVSVSLEVESAPGTVLGTRAPCQLSIARSRDEWTAKIEGETGLVGEGEVTREILRDLPIEWFSSQRQPYLAGPIRPMTMSRNSGGEGGALWRVKQRIIDERTRSAFRQQPGPDVAWLERLSHAWASLRGNDETTFAVGKNDSDEDGRTFDLYLQRKIDGYGHAPICSVDQLASGELEWLGLAGTLITTNFDGLLLVDEPELHLHPEWQSRIVPSLRGILGNSQMIMATHADAPWDQSYAFQRVLLPRDEPA